MIDKLRNSANSIIAKVLMSIFALSFLAWGTNSYFVNTPKSIAITVNGEEVSVSALKKEYDIRLAEAERQFGGKLSPEFIKTIRLGDRTINKIITTSLTLDEAKNLGFRASEKALLNEITNNNSFQDTSGKFNKEIYRNNVQNFGYSVRGYEKILSEEMQKETLYNMFSTKFHANDYLEKLYNFQNEKITIRTLSINNDTIAKIEAPTAAEIKSFYDENTHRFLTKETRDFNTLILRANDLTKRVSVNAADVKTIYDENPESFATEEEREASHILVASEEKALELIDRIDKGANFAEIAKANSVDSFTKNKGGKLGFFREADMVESFSDVAFSMEIGSISEPVKSPFGYHIIKLVAINEATPSTFEDVKLDIENELKIEKAEDLYFDLLNNIEDQIAGGSTLAEVAKSIEIPLENYAQVKLGNMSMTFATDIMPVVYSLDNGAISEAIAVEGQDTIAAFAEVTNVAIPRPLTIDEARSRMVTEIAEVKRQKMLNKKAQALLVERQNSPSLTAVAAKHNLTANISTVTNIGRAGEGAPKWLKPLQVTLLFSMKNGDKLNNVINTPEGMALVELVNIMQDKANNDDLEFFQRKVSKDIQNDLFAQYMLKKRNEANIDINRPSIQYAFDEDTTAQ